MTLFSDIRQLPLHLRKANLARLLARRPEGIFVAPFEQGEIGAELFRAAGDMGLEGMVSRHRERLYCAGRCTHWIVTVKLILFRANNSTA